MLNEVDLIMASSPTHSSTRCSNDKDKPSSATADAPDPRVETQGTSSTDGVSASTESHTDNNSNMNGRSSTDGGYGAEPNDATPNSQANKRQKMDAVPFQGGPSAETAGKAPSMIGVDGIAPPPPTNPADPFRQPPTQSPSSGHPPVRPGTGPRPNAHDVLPQASPANMARFNAEGPGVASPHAAGDMSGRRGMASYPNGTPGDLAPAGANPPVLLGDGLPGSQPPPFPGMRDPNALPPPYGVNPQIGAVPGAGEANMFAGAGGDDVVAARLRAAAVAARRDYQYATMQLRQMEAVEKQKRAIIEIGGVGRPPNAHDDIEVAHAISNLGTEVKDENILNSRYPMPGAGAMLDPLLGRYPGVGRGPDPLSFVAPQGHFMNVPLGAHPMPLAYPSADLSKQMVPRPGMQGPEDPNSHFMQLQGPNRGAKRKGSPDNMVPGGPGYGPSVATPKPPPENPKKGKRPTDMPRRPLSAYNFFFSEERERVLESLPSPNASGVEDNNDSSDKNPSSKSTDKAKDNKDEKKEEGSSDDKGGSDKEPPQKKQSNTERLLSLRMVQNNVRRPHRKTHGKIGFKALAKLIGERWRALPNDKREYYRKLADTDLSRYKDQMKEYHRKNKWSFIQQQEQQDTQQANPNPPSNNDNPSS